MSKEFNVHEEQNQNDVREERASKIEILIAVMLGITTIFGAFAAYCAALWGGEQQSRYAESVTMTNHANTVYLEALNEQSAFEMNDLRDDLIYSQWKANLENGDTEDAAYFFSKLSEGLQRDLTDNPSDTSQYDQEQLAALQGIEERFVESNALYDDADALMQQGNRANKNGDDFTLSTLLFTIVLFFLGLAALRTKKVLQRIYLTLALLIFIFSLVRMVTIPFPFLQ